MDRILFLLIYITLGLADTILIPEDFATIQEGIDASVDGDTVLVADGDYVENVVLDKSIVLTSYAIYDNLDEWIIFDDFIFNQWVINNSHIENTRLIGSSPDNADYGSVILITPDSDECISPEIVGFTIQGGSGTNVVREIDGQNVNVVLGGGILADVSDPYIHHNAFENNGSDEVYSGGAAQLTSTAEDWSFDNRFENYNPRCDVEEFRLSNNLYNGNDAQYGNSMANRLHEDDFDMSGSIFDVFDCLNEENEVSSVWVKVEPVASVEFDNGAGQLCAFTASDVYVDSTIPQECLDEGCGFSNNPFKTIARTLEMINPTEHNPITIHLAQGVYAPSTNGEIFPIQMMSYVNLEGESEEQTILDAEQSNKVLSIISCNSVVISKLKIMGGYENDMSNQGGGISIFFSNPIINNVIVSDNLAHNGGGIGIYLSNPFFYNVTIRNNEAITQGAGGGIWMRYGNLEMTHVIIENNISSGNAGGIWHLGNDAFSKMYHVDIIGNESAVDAGGIQINGIDLTMVNSTIIENISGQNGGGLHAEFGSNSSLINTSVVGNMAENCGGGMYFENSNSNIINSIIWQNSALDCWMDLSSDAILNYFWGEPSIINITYSDIQGGWPGEGNFNFNPNFTNIMNGDLTLQPGSPCIDAGALNLWYNDIDYTRNDIGAKGGPFIFPSNLNVSFGEIGNSGSNSIWWFYNFREVPVEINEVNFSTNSFSTNTNFPFTVSPNSKGVISINCLPENFGEIEDEMIINSDVLPPGITVNLNVIGSDGLILNGNLSGFLPSASYRVTGNLNIMENEILHLEAGTSFLFDGEYDFTVNGTLISIGSESDSIIFDNWGNQRWRGFTLNSVNEETIFEYVRVSGATKHDGGGLNLLDSSPIMNHMLISNNTASSYGGGMEIQLDSNPILSNVVISNNSTTGSDGGGGVDIYGSSPIFNNVLIFGNSGYYYGGGMLLFGAHPILNNVTITQNNVLHFDDPNNSGGGGIALYGSSPIIVNSIIYNNSSGDIHTIFPDSYPDEYPFIRFSDIEGGWNGEGNINSNPLFNNPENQDFTLLPNSPCIDAGTPDINNDNIDDLNNYYGSFPDMGAYEFGIIDANLSFGESYGNSIEIILQTNTPISGFQFNVIDNPDVLMLSNVSGGSSELFNFIFSSSESGTIVGFTLGTTPIPEGESVLINLEFTGYGLVELCLQDAIFSNEFGENILVEIEDCRVYLSGLSGDVNQDGEVNVLDIVIVVNFVLSLQTPDDIQFQAADINEDGLLNILDVVALVNIILSN